MADETLFTDKDGQSNPRQYDLDSLNALVVSFEERSIDSKLIGICPDKLISVMDCAHERLADFEKPGPFKKAAVLSMSLMVHSPFYYLLDDMEQQPGMNEWEWELASFIATGIARLYLTATLPEWKGWEKGAVNPPSMVSPHFMKDFRALLRIRHEMMDLRMLALVWELKTYLSNINRPIQGKLEGSEKPAIPGIF